MAAVAVAASAAGLASLAIQLGQGIVKIKAFVRDCKDAPESMDRITTELEVLSAMLRNISDDYEQQNKRRYVY